ncbi:MAG TPA: class II SORL domain-containing protein [bacterium]|nr:class II SORL domain-containing protein [bacterium]HPJ71172.1 class II SORL domain-containing protein [bacterium]HPQ65900.1 class II SORL domain-containing protein [bacterium]
MNELKNLYQSADWKSEKHVPVIEAPRRATPGEPFEVKVSVGKEIAHPNTTEHHIRWIDVYFLPEGGKFPVQIGKAEFCAHGASPEGPNTSTIYTDHAVGLSFKTNKPGTILAASYCNIHGLWQSAAAVEIE